MPRKRFKTEQILQKLREADVLLSQGKGVATACRLTEIRSGVMISYSVGRMTVARSGC